jgi:hypothetical protein
MEDEHAAVYAASAAWENRGGNFEGTRILARDFQLNATEVRFALHLFPELEQFVRAEGFEDCFAADFAFDIEKIAQGLVNRLDSPMAIEQEKAFRHGVEKSLALGFGSFGGKLFAVAETVNFTLLIGDLLFSDASALRGAPLKKNQGGEQGYDDERGPHSEVAGHIVEC